MDNVIKAIVYKSSTGHTKKYAEILSTKLKIPYYTIKEANKKLSRDDEIIYLGWICATKLSGLKKVNKKYNVRCYGMIGAYPKDEKYIQELKKSNNLNENAFYLRGGIDYTKLKGIKKKVIKMVSLAIEKENKPENKELIELFKNGGNYVSENNLEDLIIYIKNKKDE